MTYYYYFFVVGAAIVVSGVFLVATGTRPTRRSLRDPLISLGVAAPLAAVYWLPLVLSIVLTEGAESLVNRYFAQEDGIPAVPFMASTPLALASLVGLFYLVLSSDGRLSRALLALLGGAIAWWLFGLVAALAGFPLVTQRSQALIPIVLLTAAVLALARVADLAPSRVPREARTRVLLAVGLAGVVFAFVSGRAYVIAVAASDVIPPAHTTPLPDGRLPRSAPLDAAPAAISVDSISRAIDERYVGAEPPIVLSTRADVLALNTYFGFNQWHAYYAHPASRFHQRVEFLRDLASLDDPGRFAQLSAVNDYDRIDAFVLIDRDATFQLRFREDNYPEGSRGDVIVFPRELFDPTAFDIVDLGDEVVIVRRSP